jgi:hypothetical protein
MPDGDRGQAGTVTDDDPLPETADQALAIPVAQNPADREEGRPGQLRKLLARYRESQRGGRIVSRLTMREKAKKRRGQPSRCRLNGTFDPG